MTPLRALLLPLLALLLPGGAHSVEGQSLEEVEAEYRAARAAHDAALRAREAQELRFERALQEAAAARASGEEARINRAYAAAQRLAVELEGQDRRVQETARRLREVRERYLRALELRLEELLAQVGRTSDPEERRALAAILADLNNRVLELQVQGEPELTAVAFPEMVVDPRDGPEDLRRKADFLDWRGDQYQAQLLAAEEQLVKLRASQRRDRTVRDFLAGIERFDDTRVPVVPPGARGATPPPGERPPGADTLGAQERPRTLEEMIQELEVLRALLADYLEQARERASLFRRLAGGGSP